MVYDLQNKMYPLLAVIMSVYKNDTLPFVSRAVESILSQTYSNFVFYIQYDGVIEKGVDEYLSNLQDRRIVIRRRDENLGLATSLNELLAIVLERKYEFIARMDADDISFPNRFSHQIEYFKKHPDVECLGTNAIEITESGEEYYRKVMPESNEECRQFFKKRDCMIHPTVMFKKSFFEKAGVYPTSTYFAEDTLLWANGFANGCVFSNVPEFLFYYRLDRFFFRRRRGWKHAKSIFLLRHKVNRMLGYGMSADAYALGYAIAKLMPTAILNLIYKSVR